MACRGSKAYIRVRPATGHRHTAAAPLSPHASAAARSGRAHPRIHARMSHDERGASPLSVDRLGFTDLVPPQARPNKLRVGRAELGKRLSACNEDVDFIPPAAGDILVT